MSSPWWKLFDWYLAGSMTALVGFSILMLWSSSLYSDSAYLTNQLLFVVVGAVVFAVISSIDFEFHLKWSWIFYGLSLLGLIAVFLLSTATRGAASWIDFGPVSLQPSEFAKVAVILLMAWSARRAHFEDWGEVRLLLMYVGIVAIPLGFIFIQPDFGTAMVVCVGWLAAVWLSPVRKVLFGWLLMGIGLIGSVGWLLLEEYQKQRIVTFINPSADPLGSGYNVLQSMIAVGSGSMFGLGWGRGTQSHLAFLPEHHTDFIFASLSEEFGFIGSIIVIVLYGIILWRGARIVWNATTLPEVITAGGIVAFVIFQAGINIAMNVGLSPVTGVPLPLVSYGGSSLLATCIAMGLLESIAMRQAAAKLQ